MTMREAIASRACWMEGVLKCYPYETLETIIDRIAKAEVTHMYYHHPTDPMFEFPLALLLFPFLFHFPLLSSSLWSKLSVMIHFNLTVDDQTVTAKS